jgi:putative transposase
VLIGATPDRIGRRACTGLARSAARSETAWARCTPQLAIADGALGFWKAAGETRPTTRERRCWVHKTANVLAKLPKSQQPKAKRALQEIWMAEMKVDAEVAFDAFIESYQVKYEKAAECRNKDRDVLLTFYEFPAEHWKRLRTTNPSKGRSQLCATARSGRWEVHRIAPPSPWSSSLSKRHSGFQCGLAIGA